MAPASLRLLDDATGEPLVRCGVKVLWHETLRLQTDDEGVLQLPAAAVPAGAALAADGHYPEDLPPELGGELRLSPHVTVAGFVAASGALDPTAVIVVPQCRPARAGLGLGVRTAEVAADLRFPFTPLERVEHRVNLCWRTGDRVGAAFASATWRPGAPTVTIHVAGSPLRANRCRVTIELVLAPDLHEHVARARAAAATSKYQVAPHVGEFCVELVPPPGVRGRRDQRHAGITGARCVVEGFEVDAGDWFVEARLNGPGVRRRFGPFAVHEPDTRLRCVVDTAGELEVRVTGGGTADVMKAPVGFVLRDAQGDLLGVFHAADGSVDATIPAAQLPTGAVSVWPQAGRVVDGGARDWAARPLVAEVRAGERPSLAAALEPAAGVALDLDGIGPTTALTIVEPTTGARWRDVTHGRRQSWWQLAPGAWIAEVERPDAPVLRKAFVVIPGDNHVRLAD